MLFGKDLNRKPVRSATAKARNMSKSQQILSLFKVEFFVTIDGEQHFFVSEMRANHLQEACMLIQTYAHRRGGRNYQLHRKYDLGKDRSWLRGNTDYKVKVLEVKKYDHDIYEANLKLEA